jgi:hypothetical protein
MTPEQIQAFIDEAFKSGQSAFEIAEALEARGVNRDLAIDSVFGYYRDNNMPISAEDFLQTTAATSTAAFGGAEATGGGAFLDPAQETQSQAFNRFLSMTPIGQSPALRGAAQGREGLTQLQFGLQQPARTGDPSAFRQFLQSGQPLTGEGLSGRLGQLAGSLLPESLPIGSSGGALRGSFMENPFATFQTFALPQLQQIAPAFRGALGRTLMEQFNQFMGENPGATSADIARLFGFNFQQPAPAGPAGPSVGPTPPGLPVFGEI